MNVSMVLPQNEMLTRKIVSNEKFYRFHPCIFLLYFVCNYDVKELQTNISDLPQHSAVSEEKKDGGLYSKDYICLILSNF